MPDPTRSAELRELLALLTPKPTPDPKMGDWPTVFKPYTDAPIVYDAASARALKDLQQIAPQAGLGMKEISNIPSQGVLDDYMDLRRQPQVAADLSFAPQNVNTLGTYTAANNSSYINPMLNRDVGLKGVRSVLAHELAHHAEMTKTGTTQDSRVGETVPSQMSPAARAKALLIQLFPDWAVNAVGR